MALEDKSPGERSKMSDIERIRTLLNEIGETLVEERPILGRMIQNIQELQDHAENCSMGNIVRGIMQLGSEEANLIDAVNKRFPTLRTSIGLASTTLLEPSPQVKGAVAKLGAFHSELDALVRDTLTTKCGCRLKRFG